MVHPVNGTKDKDQGLSDQDRKLLDRLAKRWRSETERGLKLRHETGKALNRRLGPPTRRKAHGRRVLVVYGKELGIAPSDLHRMGWFAHLFPDFSDFREQHPEIGSWTQFKTALPSLKPTQGGKARKPVKNASRPESNGIAKSIASLTAKLNRLDIPPVGAEKERLKVVVQEMLKAVSRRLKIPVKVSVGVKDSKPVATKRLNRVA